MMHNLRWDDLQIVLAVAEQRSLSGAARIIGVNHATVLRRIEALEGQLGTRLFDRPPGGYRLKPEAQELLSSLRTIAQTVGRVERSLTAARLGTGGSFRLTTTDSVANYLLPRHLERLRAERPDVQVELLISNNPLDMTRPEAEITLRPTRSLPDGMRGERAGEMAFSVFGSAAYLAENPSADMADHHWIGVAPPLTRSPIGLWQDARLPVPPATRADSFVTIARLVAEGSGLAMLPTFIGRAEPGLAPAPQFPDREVTDFWVAAHADLLGVQQVSDLIAFFVDAMRADASLLV